VPDVRHTAQQALVCVVGGKKGSDAEGPYLFESQALIPTHLLHYSLFGFFRIQDKLLFAKQHIPLF
jgi:hypothetical protein